MRRWSTCVCSSASVAATRHSASSAPRSSTGNASTVDSGAPTAPSSSMEPTGSGSATPSLPPSADGAGAADVGASSPAAPDIELRPTNATLPPYVRPTGPKWSFIGTPNTRTLIEPDFHTNNIVPNNEAKAQLPMWSSSLTSPKLELQRLRVDTWMAPHLSAGFHDSVLTEAFVQWVKERADAAEALQHHGTTTGQPSSSYCSYALEHHVQLKLRAGGSCRGVFARRSFDAGDVILSLPSMVPMVAATASSDGPAPPTPAAAERCTVPLWGLHLNSETLRMHSAHAQRCGVPSFETVREIVSKRRTSFDPYPHPLFIDQVYGALFLACEKEAGAASPLYPYLRLLPDPPVDDEAILDIYRSVMDPASHLEYNDHRRRMRFYLLQIHDVWSASVAASPAAKAAEGQSNDVGSGPQAQQCPSVDALEWGLRTILSRQLMLPYFRQERGEMTEQLAKVATVDDVLKQENFWMRNITRFRRWWLTHVFRVMDHHRLTQNDFDPRTIPTVSPLFDMLQHDPKGGNVAWEVERDDAAGDAAPHLLLVARKPIREGQELTRSFRRCYSASYTLYRYGFLAVNDREVDARSDLVDAGHDATLIGRDAENADAPVATIEAGGSGARTPSAALPAAGSAGHRRNQKQRWLGFLGKNDDAPSAAAEPAVAGGEHQPSSENTAAHPAAGATP